MASRTVDDEDLAEESEVLYENANVLDDEPLYSNFPAIQNDRRYGREPTQLNTSFRLHNTRNAIDRVETETAQRHGRRTVTFKDLTDSSEPCVHNLTQIVRDIGYDPRSPFLSSSHSRIASVELSNTPSAASFAQRPQIHVSQQYYQNWYSNRFHQSAPANRFNPMNQLYQQTTEKLEESPSNIAVEAPDTADVSVKETDDEEGFQNGISRMYGFDDEEEETAASECSRHSSIDRTASPVVSERFPSPLPPDVVEPPKPKQITIREYFSRQDLQSLMVNGSISPSSLQTTDDNSYDRVLRKHPDVYQGLQPEIIKKPNPEEIVYKQNVTVRYLCPPTPPPPGPLIIREILPPRAPSPPPLVINDHHHHQPEPATPPPLILREEPPLPPPIITEPKVITKLVPHEPSRSQRLYMEEPPTLPPKPQSIIIERWLPYKPQPPREVIYERLANNRTLTEFQPYDRPVTKERRTTKSVSRIPIPVHVERQRSYDYLGKERNLSTFDQFARATQSQLEVLQQQTFQQMPSQQYWLTNQQPMNMCGPSSMPLLTPPLVINHRPVTRVANMYAYPEFYPQPMYCPQPYMYPAYM